MGDLMNEELSMNLDDRIGKQTVLYGYIAIEASKNRLSHNFNKALKESSRDGMMIPMNIREDDFYFTLSNMKKSHVNGAMLGLEYQQNILELLDSRSSMVEQCGACDFVKRVGQTLEGDFITPKVIANFIATHHEVKKIAILGDTPLAYGLTLLLQEYEIAYFHSEIERLLEMSQALHVEIDINFLSVNGVDLSGFDMMIDTRIGSDGSLVTAPALIKLDINDLQIFSNTMQEFPTFYTNYLIEDL